VGADALTKVWASRQAAPDPAVSTALVQVRHVTNAGAALGLGAQHPALVLGLALVATTVVVWWLAKVTWPVERVAVAVLLGGAVGNLADRVVNGAVTDWIHVAWYPATFNLADVAIRGGALVAATAHVLRRRGTEPVDPVVP
jgi:signal peptidase II